jgi:hypothetical protein
MPAGAEALANAVDGKCISYVGDDLCLCFLIQAGNCCCDDRRLPGAMLDSDADNCPTSIGQHSMHFGKRRGFVRNELQAMLANGTVESRISMSVALPARHSIVAAVS